MSQEITFSNWEVSPTNTKFNGDVTLESPLCELQDWNDVFVFNWTGTEIENGQSIPIALADVTFLAGSETLTTITIDSFPLQCESSGGVYQLGAISVVEDCAPVQSGNIDFTMELSVSPTIEVNTDKLKVNGSLDIQDFINLAPSNEPNNPQTGTIYLDAGTLKLRMYNGTTWEDLN